ncbi:hypothetical protein, partial [Salmonella sp. s51228]|uniref:hypothetical protein n=1 Tax=Salmonella sp. s51228 TaxID=3159652 RepID=UPI003980E8EE
WHWTNDINLKKGVEFANGMMNYFHMLQRYFTDGADFLKALQDWCDKKTSDLSALKTLSQEDQKDLEKSISSVKEFVHDPPLKPDRASYSLHAAK